MQAQLERMAEISRQKAEDAQIKAENSALAARKEKSSNWARVKKESPQDAQILTEFGRVFGRLPSVELTVIETGEFLKLR